MSECYGRVSSVLGTLAVGAGFAVCTAAADDKPAPELRAFVHESCVVADEPWLAPQTPTSQPEQITRAGPLTVLVVSKLAEVIVAHSIKATAGRISEGAARKDTRYAFARETNLYRVDFTPQPQLALNAHLGCITLVAASFAPTASCHEQYQPRVPAEGYRGKPESEWQSTRSDTSVANVLRRSDICVLGAPRSVYEARFEFSPDGTAWRLVNAGYQVDTLLTAREKRAERNVFYTLEVLQPTGTATRGDSLTTGIVTLGKVRAGARAEEGAAAGAWLRVPPLNAEARRNYELRTALHQETWAEIGALERAIKRNERIQVEVRQRRLASKGELAKGLAAEETRLGVQHVTLEAELGARRAEYAALPAQTHEFMPVGIEVGLTESRSEQPALLALAAVMKQSSGFIGSTAGQLAQVSRSVAVSEEAQTGAAQALSSTRAAWHDARVSTRLAETPDERDAAAPLLAQTRAAYEEARMQIGLTTELPR
jgi:hypothetical protein